jgi:plastocyanin
MYFRDRMEPSTWEVLGYDLPETAEDSDVPGYLGYVPNVPMTPDHYALARSRGIFVRVVGDIPSSTPDWDVCYRDYPAMLTYLNSVVSRFPNLATLTDIGDSWCKAHLDLCTSPHAGNGFDVWRVKLTNSAIPGPKPRFHLVAAHHAREIATPELAMQWIEDLVTGYGTNADFTWLLDNREVYVVPVENLDGWFHAATDQVYWRKNDNPAGCSYPDNGVDPNRNYPICWSCPGGGSSPCSETYWGVSAGSETETQNMMNEYNAVDPHFVISLHTVGPYVLYPWGNSGYGAPADRAGLDALAWNMGRINNTTPRNRVGQPYNVLYNVSGTTDDWTYANFAVPSFTIELGGYSDFNAPCSVLPTIVNNYKPTLTYALKATSSITQTSYMHAFGPTPNSLSGVINGTTLNASAVISANYGTTTGAVYRIDQLPEDGIGTPMMMSGQNASAAIDVSPMPNGRHTLFVQGKAAYSYNGNSEQWGIVSAVFFTVTNGSGTATSTTVPPTPTRTNTLGVTATNTTVAIPTFTPTRTSTPGATATCVPASTLEFVSIEDNYFNPQNATIPAGTRVLWTNGNNHSYAHTTTSNTGLWDSGSLDDGRQFGYTFYTPGTYAYHCTIHPSMTGTITVQPATPCPTSTSTATRTPTSLPATSTPTSEVQPTPCGITFMDVPADSTFYTWIRCLACRGIMSGYTDGTFKPGNDITRGQIAKIVSNSAGFNEDAGPQIYEDVPAGSPFYDWINRLSMRGHMGGYLCGLVPEEPCIAPDNRPYFRPNASATRGQLAKIVANAAGLEGDPIGLYYTDVPEDHTFYVWIMRLTQLGVMGGYPCGGENEPCDDQNRPYFRPFANVTRGQASKIVANTFFPNCQTP